MKYMDHPRDPKIASEEKGKKKISPREDAAAVPVTD